MKASLSWRPFSRSQGELGLDAEKLQADMSGEEVEQRLAMNDSAAEGFNIGGTPGFVLGGEVIPGAVPRQEFIRIAAEVRAAPITLGRVAPKAAA